MQLVGRAGVDTLNDVHEQAVGKPGAGGDGIDQGAEGCIDVQVVVRHCARCLGQLRMTAVGWSHDDHSQRADLLPQIVQRRRVLRLHRLVHCRAVATHEVAARVGDPANAVDVVLLAVAAQHGEQVQRHEVVVGEVEWTLRHAAVRRVAENIRDLWSGRFILVYG